MPLEGELEAAGITPAMVAEASFMKGAGCSACNGTGYRGRIGIYELMMMSSRIRELLFKNASMSELRQAAIDGGMRTLYRDGIAKVMKGVTTLDEVFRVAKRTESDQLDAA